MQDISVLYRNALHALTTDIVDQYIDNNMGLGNIENAKIVAEDQLSDKLCMEISTGLRCGQECMEDLVLLYLEYCTIRLTI